MVSCEWPSTVVRDRSSALCWPPRHSIFPPRSLHANCCDLDKMTVAPGEVAKQFSRTQIRRLQRRHTQLSYHQLKQRLLDILVPSPPAVMAADLERSLESHQAVHRGAACAWCGLWTPLPTASTWPRIDDCSVARASAPGDCLVDVAPVCDPYVDAGISTSRVVPLPCASASRDGSLCFSAIHRPTPISAPHTYVYPRDRLGFISFWDLGRTMCASRFLLHVGLNEFAIANSRAACADVTSQPFAPISGCLSVDSDSPSRLGGVPHDCNQQ